MTCASACKAIHSARRANVRSAVEAGFEAGQRSGCVLWARVRQRRLQYRIVQGMEDGVLDEGHGSAVVAGRKGVLQCPQARERI